jgi:hypothetical protein
LLFVAFCCAARLLWFGCCALSIYFLLYALIVLGLVGGFFAFIQLYVGGYWLVGWLVFDAY